MKKILKNRVFQIVFILLIVLLLVLLCFFNRVDEDIVTRVSKVLGYKYYNIECLNDKCNYVVAYSGDKNGKTTVKVINSNGKTVGKYRDIYSKDDELRYKPVYANNKYIILSYMKENDSNSYGYKVLSSNGKELLKTNNLVSGITNDYFYETGEDLYTIYDYKGTPLYKDVTDLTLFNDKKIISFNNNDELTIIDKDSNRILNGYTIKEEVKDDKGTLYLIVEDLSGGYYYFDIINNKIIGESFNNYMVMSNNKLLITKKINNVVKKYLINIKGKTEKELLTNNEIYDKVTDNIDRDSYQIMDESIFSDNQKGLLVKSIKDNSFGIYEIKTGTYNKLFDFKYEDNQEVNIYNLYESLDKVYLQVGCSTNYCNEENIIVYNPVDNKVSFKISNSEKEIKKYREYTGGYKVLTYTDKTYDLFDENNNVILSSENNIVVLDQKVLIDDDTIKSNALLYLSEGKGLINSSDNLATLNSSSNYNFYEYFTEKNMYLYGIDGKLIKKIPIEYSNINVADKYISYLGKNKINIINLKNNKTKSYDLTTKQFVIDSNSVLLSPYKGSIVITDVNDNTIKVANYNKKMIKKIKNSTVESVNFDKENNRIFLITKQDKNYGLYIIK